MQTNRIHEFKTYISENSPLKSNKTSSYVRALDLLSEMLKRDPASFQELQDIWNIPNTLKLEQLYEFLLKQAKLGDRSIWAYSDLPVSYLRDGFCSAAIKQYHSYLVEQELQSALFSAYKKSESLSLQEYSCIKDHNSIPTYLIEQEDATQGVDKERLVKQRMNQNIFRKMVRGIYQGRCCITGLSIPSLNRASHIVGWAKDASKRLDPRNGLYLSATYDAAFDRHLISLDDDYRIILSSDLKGFETEDSFKQYFAAVDGQSIHIPTQMSPKREYLELHRNEGHF